MHARILRARLRHQHLLSPPAAGAADVVRRLGAVQAQEYPGARLSLALRSRSLSRTAVDEALAAGEILRTHVLRDTWHLVAADDIRWLVTATRPRILKRNEAMYRRFGLDARTLDRTAKILAVGLRGGRHLKRAELGSLLGAHGIDAEGTRLAYILMHAELELLVCSGAPAGKQQTYALLDERVPQGAPPTGDEALAELARRFFSSRGPATTKDFAWWASLTVTSAGHAVERAEGGLVRVEVDGRTYWSPPLRSPSRRRVVAHLLPTYDEYLVAYPESRDVAGARLGVPAVLVDGRFAGTWRRRPGGELELLLERRLDDAEQEAVDDAVARSRTFEE